MSGVEVSKVLIANRGEIACRIARAARALSMRSVAVYSEADVQSLHVIEADEAVLIGPAQASKSYLDVELVLAAARKTGAQAIHPGYGFLSENPDFAERCEAEGLVFVGPRPAQIRAFGLKHEARRLASESGVPLLPGSELLIDVDAATDAAKCIGYPVMLKSTAGGGGIGMAVCRSDADLSARFLSVQRLAKGNFSNAGVFLEKFVENARHVEAQIFGDGTGRVLFLGVRDCSSQRRNQKVIEETPAPHLSEAQEGAIREAALKLGRAVSYRSAGTVEFVLDADTGNIYFLEVNTRLQVEHCVTEEVCGVDLPGFMLRLARGDLGMFEASVPAPYGHALEARVYAEDPARNFQPCSGLLTEVRFPSDARIETWVETGVEVTPHYDPLLAKIIVHAATRDEAVRKLSAALAETRIVGIETNVRYLRQIVESPVFRAGKVTTRTLSELEATREDVEVLEPGTHTTVQDYPGRLGYWSVGIPPSGPMDALSLRLGNLALGNPEGAPALEITVSGPCLRFHAPALIALAGAPLAATLDDQPLSYYAPHAVAAGQTLRIGQSEGAGVRAYLCLRGGFDAPTYLGSAATFTLGGFGGHAGRALRSGDVLKLGTLASVGPPATIEEGLRPLLTRNWTLSVMHGPHGAPDFFTEHDIATFFSSEYTVHHNSARTGVRLMGPKPEWARKDGGEAGLHPSNIHDCAYAIGTVDFTGDMPIILGPDGPSLGGFVCPASVIESELWKTGQLGPGDTVRFVSVSYEEARARKRAQDESLRTRKATETRAQEPPIRGDAIVSTLPARAGSFVVTYRQASDAYLLVEYGAMVLDLHLRFRVHALMQHLREQRVGGILELTPGIRSLQVHYDSERISQCRLIDLLQRSESALGDASDLTLPTRVLHLPLSWDDPQTQLAIEKYMKTVRADAPWTPSNIEFIRRINGLPDESAVRDTVFNASYLVLGLGDVYLGAPVATPLDPRHRLITTKYNPARTWTPENAVGIGGAYMCIYGMEGPGGYQFVGRTLQVYNRFRATRDFQAGTPWLLRFFDQIRFYPVSSSELLELRGAFLAGRHELEVEQSSFSVAAYDNFLAQNRNDIDAFQAGQRAAFEAERQRWVASGQNNFSASLPDSAAEEGVLPEGSLAVSAHVPGSVWKVLAHEGQRVSAGDPLVILESMKMELTVSAPAGGKITRVVCREGQSVSAGQTLVALGV